MIKLSNFFVLSLIFCLFLLSYNAFSSEELNSSKHDIMVIPVSENDEEQDDEKIDDEILEDVEMDYNEKVLKSDESKERDDENY